MIRLKGSPHSTTASFLSSAIGVAEFYGFKSLDELPRLHASERIPLPIGARSDSDISFARRDERGLVSAARKIISSQSPQAQRTFAWRVIQVPGTIPKVALELHIAGVPSSIAEALLIVAADAIAEEAGVRARAISLNNMGSAESCGRFARDVGAYLRKHLDTIAPSLRPRVAQDPVGALIQLIERGHPAMSRAPQATEYLSEDERKRFWDLLEYLEVFGLSYELNSHILGSRDCWAHSLFEIHALDPETDAREVIATGGRYDPLFSRFQRAPGAAAMVAIHIESRGSSRPRPRALGIPSIYFAHLGLEARRRSLRILEDLRRSGIPVYHGLYHERIGEQMEAARSLASPLILIIGHKEALEGTILVREVATNSQEAVPLPELPAYLKHRRAGYAANLARA